MVGLTGFKLNQVLDSYLAKLPLSLPTQIIPFPHKQAYKHAKRLNRSTIAKLAAAYEAGQSRDELSDAFGIAPSSVIAVLRAEGVAIRWRRSPELEQKVVALFSAGSTQAEISRQLGKHKGYIWHVLNRHGLVGRRSTN